MPPPSLKERVAAFPQWHYAIDLGGGVRTPVYRSQNANRHTQRSRYFFDALVRLCGGSLADRRVLDLGCNAGFWSLKALEAGADFVVGVDGRQMYIDQAELVMEANGIEPSRFRFEQANLFAWEPGGQFDIVLCLGLLYHVARPVELLERCARWGRDILVLDTNLSWVAGSAVQIVKESPSNPRSSVEYELVMRPTRQAVIDLTRVVGFQSVAVLRPRFSSWEGCLDFRLGGRRAFFASKRTPLRGLDEERPTMVDRAREEAIRTAFRMRGRVRAIQSVPDLDR